MKLSIAVSLLLVVTAFAAPGASQTVPADSNPVLQGTAIYTMPQSAIDAKISGSVMVAVRVDETGKPAGIVLVYGPSWPCGTTPVKALEELSSTLSSEMMKLRFSPAIKDGKPVAKNVGLRLELINPGLQPKPVEIDPATGKPKPRVISGGVLNGKATFLPKPVYPPEARGKRESGAVTIQILIDEEGKVIRASAVSGSPGLQFASREAACNAKFPPTTLSGNPVQVSGVLTYNFIP